MLIVKINYYRRKMNQLGCCHIKVKSLPRLTRIRVNKTMLKKEPKKPFYTVFILENPYETGLIVYLESLLVEIVIYQVNDTVNSVAFSETKLNFTCNSIYI